MTRIGLTHRLAAATIAVLVTTSTVWGMANLGHPAKAAPVVLAKQSCPGLLDNYTCNTPCHSGR